MVQPLILAVAICSVGRFSDGPLTPWNKEEASLAPYWGDELVYSCRVHDLWQLSAPLVSPLPLTKINLWSPECRSEISQLRVSHCPAWSAGPPETKCMCEVLHQHGIEPAVEHGGRTLHLVPVVRPITDLITKKEWSSIVLPRSLHGTAAQQRRRAASIRGYWPYQVRWPPAAWFAKEANCSSPVAFESMYVFDEWLQNLRSWAPAIIAHHGDLARHSLENMAEGLTHLIRANAGHVQAGVGRHGLRYTALHLINSIRMSAALRHRGKLQEALRRSVNVLFGSSPLLEPLLAALDDKGDDGKSLAVALKPHSVSRHQLTIDVALMLAQREWWSGVASGGLPNKPLIWWFIDSSPQAGHDWLLSTSDMVMVDDIQALFTAFHDLANASSSEERARMREQAWDLVDRKMHRHVWPPTALGKGKTSTEDKFAAWTHSVWLESDTAALQHVLDCTMSVTPDLGTESTLPDIKSMDIKAMLPKWTQADDQLLPDCAHVLDDDGLMADVHGHHHSQHGPAMQDGFVFKHSLLIAGLNHIVANAEAQTDQSLPYWPTYIKHLRPVVKWASLQDNLDKFLESCLRGSAYWHCKHLFDSPLPNLAEWRWGTVRSILSRLKFMLPVLRLVWDDAKYSRGERRVEEGQHVEVEGERRPERDERHSTNLPELTSILKSRLFGAFTDMCLMIKKAPSELLAKWETCKCCPSDEEKSGCKAVRRSGAAASVSLGSLPDGWQGCSILCSR